jgi:hypothetical protein
MIITVLMHTTILVINSFLNQSWGRYDLDCMVVSWIYNYLPYAISAYHHYHCEFESCLWRGVLNTTLCDKVCK